jgi:hypothetical protein
MIYPLPIFFSNPLFAIDVAMSCGDDLCDRTIKGLWRTATAGIPDSYVDRNLTTYFINRLCRIATA